jgi:hypothetical protein
MVRAAWPNLLKRVEDQHPLLLESLQRYAPVRITGKQIVLKGELKEEFLQGKLRSQSASLAGIFQQELGQPLEIIWEEAALKPDEIIQGIVHAHLDSTSRFEELKQDLPVLDELYKRMCGRLLKG